MAGLLLLLTLAGCDQSFEPIPAGDRGFSLYGFLDAAADTQWVRVTEVRDLLATAPQPVDARVSLQEAGTGRTIVLRDSLFGYPASNLDPTLNRYARNFWTTEPLRADVEYRIVAERSDGFRSSATVVIPPAIEEVAVEYSLRNPLASGTVTFSGGPYIGMMLVYHYGCGSGGPRVIYQDLPPPAADGLHRVRVLLNDPGNEPCVGDKRIRIVSSGVPWLFAPDWDEAAALLPDAASNVENGVGFVGGVITRTIPVELCTSMGTPGPNDVCTLRYDERSATIEGRIWDTLCGSRQLMGSTLSLREVDGDRIRSPRRGGVSSFRIEALEPDIPYILTLRLAGYMAFEQALSFEPGEERVLDIALRREGASVEC